MVCRRNEFTVNLYTQTSSKCGELEMVIWQLEAIMECRIRCSDSFKLLSHIQLLNVLNRLGWLTMWFCASTHCNCEGTLHIVLFVFGATALQWAMASSFSRFLDHTQRRTTVGRIPLDEWSARRRDPYMTKHNTHNRYINDPGGIRTHNLSRRAAADLRLRPRGYWDWPLTL